MNASSDDQFIPWMVFLLPSYNTECMPQRIELAFTVKVITEGGYFILNGDSDRKENFLMEVRTWNIALLLLRGR